MRQLCCHRELINIPGWNWNEILKNKSLKEDLAKIDFKKEGTDGASVSEEGKRMAALLREMIINGVTDDCSICLGDLKVPVISPCSHVFCKGCIEGFLDGSSADQRLCPLCRNPLQKNQLLGKNILLLDFLLNNFLNLQRLEEMKIQRTRGRELLPRWKTLLLRFQAARSTHA